mmetsp:Transcript_8502/g.16281  ORF Transcript_8502/g.16281 Transcript_8502/m.16281 type:complete len:222 (-) Transcript_8502:111-776(-)
MALAKNPAMKILLEAPRLDLEDSETSGRTFDDEHDDNDDEHDDDSSMKEILQEYLSQQKKQTDEAVRAALDEVSVPARRPKLYRTPTPDPDGLYLAIRNAPRRARKKRTNIAQEEQANEDFTPNQAHTAQVVVVVVEEDDDDNGDLPVPLCRNKSFEGIMGDYVRNAVPKKVPPRRREEMVYDREPGATVGTSRSFDEQDFLQALGMTKEAARRGARRPGR